MGEPELPDKSRALLQQWHAVVAAQHALNDLRWNREVDDFWVAAGPLDHREPEPELLRCVN
jgi:hypothetical protein